MEIDALVAKILPQQLQSVKSLLHQRNHFFFGMAMKIIQDLGDTPKTGKSGIFSAGAVGKKSAFKNENPCLRESLLKAQGAVESGDAAAYDREIGPGEPGLGFPIGEVHAVNCLDESTKDFPDPYMKNLTVLHEQ